MTFIKYLQRATRDIKQKRMPCATFEVYGGTDVPLAVLNKAGIYDVREYLKSLADGTKTLDTYEDLQVLNAALSVVEYGAVEPRRMRPSFWENKCNEFRKYDVKGDDVLL